MARASAILLFILIAAAAQAAAAQVEEAKPKDLTGSWRVVAEESLGVRTERAPEPDQIWVFDKGILTVRGKGGRKEAPLTYRENAKASPCEFEWTREARAGDKPPKPEPGIYKFEDGKLLLCYCSGDPFGGGPRQRPKEFAGPVAKIGECSFSFYILEPVGKAPPK